MSYIKLARICVMMLMAVGVSAMAADNGKKNSTKETATTRPTQQTKGVKSLKGEIASINLETRSLNVTVKDKQQQISTVTVIVDEKTDIQLDGQSVTLADLKVGMQVRVSPETGTAVRIIARSEIKKNEKRHKDGQPAAQQ